MEPGVSSLSPVVLALWACGRCCLLQTRNILWATPHAVLRYVWHKFIDPRPYKTRGVNLYDEVCPSRPPVDVCTSVLPRSLYPDCIKTEGKQALLLSVSTAYHLTLPVEPCMVYTKFDISARHSFFSKQGRIFPP